MLEASELRNLCSVYVYSMPDTCNELRLTFHLQMRSQRSLAQVGLSMLRESKLLVDATSEELWGIVISHQWSVLRGKHCALKTAVYFVLLFCCVKAAAYASSLVFSEARQQGKLRSNEIPKSLFTFLKLENITLEPCSLSFWQLLLEIQVRCRSPVPARELVASAWVFSTRIQHWSAIYFPVECAWIVYKHLSCLIIQLARKDQLPIAALVVSGAGELSWAASAGAVSRGRGPPNGRRSKHLILVLSWSLLSMSHMTLNESWFIWVMWAS